MLLIVRKCSKSELNQTQINKRYSKRHALGPIPKAQLAFKDLMIHEYCNSHDVSHFAAFFIVVGTKISIAKSCKIINK
jgi:hypothetical protein